MRGIVLVCGDAPHAADVPADRVVRVPGRPGKAELDDLLSAASAGFRGADVPKATMGTLNVPNATLGTSPGGAHIIVAGTDADLAAVVLRLLRRELLATVTLGFLPPPGSFVAALWRLPTEPQRAWQLASTGLAAPVPVIRDDAGGVLVGRGVLADVDGVAYCDDDLAVRGTARRIEVQPDADGGAGLVVRVRRGRLRPRERTLRGRAFQFGGTPMTPMLDGVRRERPMRRWTWYRHTEDLLLVRP